VTFNKL